MSTVPATAKARMTADEFWEFVHRPENETKQLELIRGEVREMSRPTRLHGIVQVNIGSMLRDWARQIGRGYVAVESGVVLDEDPDTVVGPDAAYYTDAETYEDVHPKWGDVPPVLAVEVLSPNDKWSQVNDRVREYLLSGTLAVWVVNYEERHITVYRPNTIWHVIRGDEVLVAGDDFPGLSISLAEVFRFPQHFAPAPPKPPVS